MTLLVSIFAAVICTVVWYSCAQARKLKLGMLCWMFWGSSLMWLTDAAFEYAKQGTAYFTPATIDMVNDLFFGLSMVALALVVWLAVLLIKDPQGVVWKSIFPKNEYEYTAVNVYFKVLQPARHVNDSNSGKENFIEHNCYYLYVELLE